MDETHRTHPSALFLAFLAGAATGAAVALLTAPQSGRVTRQRLKGLARDAAGRASHLPEVLNEAYARAAGAARQAFIETLEGTLPGGRPHAGGSGH